MQTRLSTNFIPIEKIEVSCYTIPTDSPESDGTLEWDHTTLVLVEASGGGRSGVGYTYAGMAAAQMIHTELAHVVRGNDGMDVASAWAAMARAVRNHGRPGICSMAIAAVDSALWDLKAKLLGVSMAKLLGMARDGAPIYGSGGFTSYSIDRLQSQLAHWVAQGIPCVKMKVGRNPDEDAGRVRAAREAIGRESKLFVDANGAYSRKQALHFSEVFHQFGVTWFEEPVVAADLEGLHLLCERAPADMEIAAGEYGYDLIYFRKMLDEEAVDVLQADATRCAGITGFLGVAALCEARSIPLSSHTAPALHLPLGCAVIPFRHLEYFHDHVRIERLLFDGLPKPVNGVLYPDLTRPGFGIELRRADAQRYAAA